MIALVLDASTYTGTVAVVRDGIVIAAAETAMRGEREERLMPAVATVMAAAEVAAGDLDLVICGAGPGSFTSLRIAASIAKGIAFARGIPLHAVSSLVLMVAAIEPRLPAGRYLAVLDALRGDAYAQLVEVGADGVSPAGDALLVAIDDVRELASSLGAAVVGVAGAPDVAIAGIPHARGVVRVSGIGAVDVATWEPDYGRLAEAQVRWEAAHGRPLPRGRT